MSERRQLRSSIGNLEEASWKTHDSEAEIEAHLTPSAGGLPGENPQGTPGAGATTVGGTTNPSEEAETLLDGVRGVRAHPGSRPLGWGCLWLPLGASGCLWLPWTRFTAPLTRFTADRGFWRSLLPNSVSERRQLRSSIGNLEERTGESTKESRGEHYGEQGRALMRALG